MRACVCCMIQWGWICLRRSTAPLYCSSSYTSTARASKRFTDNSLDVAGLAMSVLRLCLFFPDCYLEEWRIE